MKSRTKTALGIDIGDRQVSAALVEKTEQGVRIVAGAKADLPTEEDRGRISTRGKALAQVLRKLGRRARARNVPVAVATSAPSVILRLLDLPKQMPTNVGEFVDGELKQYVAMSGRSVSSDFCGVGTGKASQKRLLAVAADTPELTETVEIYMAAGLAAKCVEPAVLACVRAVLATVKDIRRGHALVGMLTRTHLVLCLFANGIFDFVRTRDVPNSLETAGKFRTWLAEEINAVLRYYRTQTPGGTPRWRGRLIVRDAALPAGDLAELSDLEPSVETLTIAESDAALEDAVGPSDPRTPVCVAAVGAALRLLDVEGDDLRIDLTPPEVAAARSSSRRGLIAANAAAVGLVAIFLLGQYLARTNAAKNRHIAHTRVAEQLSTMPAVVTQDRFIDGEIEWMTKELAGLAAVSARREVNWPAVLDTIGNAVPEGVCLTRMTCADDQTLSLKGLAVSARVAQTFVQNLDGRAPFHAVCLTGVQRLETSANLVEYEVNCILKPVNQGSDVGRGS